MKWAEAVKDVRSRMDPVAVSKKQWWSWRSLKSGRISARYSREVLAAMTEEEKATLVVIAVVDATRKLHGFAWSTRKILRKTYGVDLSEFYDRIRERLVQKRIDELPPLDLENVPDVVTWKPG